MTSQNPDLRALVEAWAEDTNFCWTAVAARLEWMALQEISLGKITLTNENNGSVISEYDVDYQIPAERKLGFQTGSASWATSASAKPISKDFKNVVKAAKKEGVSLKFAFMSLDTFATFAETAEVQKICASFAVNALNLQQTPSLEQVNSAMKTLPYLKGLQLVVIDQDITVELPNGDKGTLTEADFLAKTTAAATSVIAAVPSDGLVMASRSPNNDNSNTLPYIAQEITKDPEQTIAATVERVMGKITVTAGGTSVSSAATANKYTSFSTTVAQIDNIKDITLKTIM